MRKKIVAALMASVMCLSVLAGCGNQPAEGSSGASGTGTTPAPSGSNATLAPSGGDKTDDTNNGQTWTQTWPDGQKITWLVGDDGYGDDPKGSRYYQLSVIPQIEEMFHVDIEFIIFDTKAKDTKADYLTMVSTDPLPDVIATQNGNYYKPVEGKSGIPGLKEMGVIPQSLNEIIDTKMPNMKKILENPKIAKELSNDEGEYLYLGRINPLETETDILAASSIGTHGGLVMRKDWLDAVGMDVPTNIDEWYKVLTAFKAAYPDKIPFCAYASGIEYFVPAYGILSDMFIDPATGKVECGARTQAYKEFLTEMNKWYSEGLMEDAFKGQGDGSSPSGKDYDAKVTSGQTGSWKGLANNGGSEYVDAQGLTVAAGKFQKEIEKNEPQAELVAAPYLKAKDGKIYYPRYFSSRPPKDTVIITVDAKKEPAKMDAIAAVMDYMLSDECTQLMIWGEEGLTFVKDSNGERRLTEKGNEAVTVGTKKPQFYKMYGNSGIGFPTYGYFDNEINTRSDWYVNALKTWTADTSNILAYPDSISVTWDDQGSQLGTYISSMREKFITGEEPLSNFDTYVAELERLGISDKVKTYQAAYDAYQKK